MIYDSSHRLIENLWREGEMKGPHYDGIFGVLVAEHLLPNNHKQDWSDEKAQERAHMHEWVCEKVEDFFQVYCLHTIEAAKRLATSEPEPQKLLDVPLGVGDVVWACLKRCDGGWWPGLIGPENEGDAWKRVKKGQTEFRVRFYGDETYTFLSDGKLKIFELDSFTHEQSIRAPPPSRTPSTHGLLTFVSRQR